MWSGTVLGGESLYNFQVSYTLTLSAEKNRAMDGGDTFLRIFFNILYQCRCLRAGVEKKIEEQIGKFENK